MARVVGQGTTEEGISWMLVEGDLVSHLYCREQDDYLDGFTAVCPYCGKEVIAAYAEDDVAPFIWEGGCMHLYKGYSHHETDDKFFPYFNVSMASRTPGVRLEPSLDVDKW